MLKWLFNNFPPHFFISTFNNSDIIFDIHQNSIILNELTSNHLNFFPLFKTNSCYKILLFLLDFLEIVTFCSKWNNLYREICPLHPINLIKSIIQDDKSVNIGQSNRVYSRDISQFAQIFLHNWFFDGSLSVVVGSMIDEEFEELLFGFGYFDWISHFGCLLSDFHDDILDVDPWN